MPPKYTTVYSVGLASARGHYFDMWPRMLLPPLLKLVHIWITVTVTVEPKLMTVLH